MLGPLYIRCRVRIEWAACTMHAADERNAGAGRRKRNDDIQADLIIIDLRPQITLSGRPGCPGH